MASRIPQRPSILAVILAGGLARRMGGDKAGVRLGGVPLLDRVVARIAGQAGALVLNVNGDPGRFARSALAILPDSLPGHPGPLAGVLAALDHAAGQGVSMVLSVPCDAPFLPADLFARMAVAGPGGGVAMSGGRAHPTMALWPVARRHDLRRAMVEEGVRKVRTMTERFGLAPVAWPAEPFDPFMNVNTPDDLAAAEDVLRRWPRA